MNNDPWGQEMRAKKSWFRPLLRAPLIKTPDWVEETYATSGSEWKKKSRGK